MVETVICGYWDGYCQAIMSPTCPDAKKVKREWVRDGAEEIRVLPRDEGIDALQAYMKIKQSKVQEGKNG